MADRYFVPVSGAGVWSSGSTTNWSATSGGSGGASAPTVADNVIFDQSGSYTVTMATGPSCLNITVTAGTVNFTTSGSTAISVTIAGSMSLLPSTTWNITAGVSTTTFSSTSAGRTITTYGTTFPCDVTFSGGGSWSFGSAFNVSALRTTTFTSGTLNLNGYDFTTGIFLSTNTNTRSISFGSNNIVLAHTSAGQTVLSMTNVGNFTWTGTGGFTATAAVARTYIFGTTGGSTTNAPNLTLTGSGTGVQTFTTGSWFNNLNFGTTAFTVPATTLNLNSLTLSSSGTFTNLSITMVGTSTINTIGKTIAGFAINNGAGTITLASALGCTTYTQTAGTIDFATFNLTCSGAVAYTAGTLTNTGTITCTTWTVTGTFTMTNGTITPSTSFVINSGAFNYNGGTLSPVSTFTQTAGNVTLGKAYALTTTGTYTLTAGALSLNGFTLTTGIFASAGSAVRSIAFGANNIVLVHTTAGTTVLSMATNMTNFTCTGTGGFTATAAITRTYVFGSTGGSATNAPNLTLTESGTAVQSFTTNSWFNKLDFGTTAFTQSAAIINVNSLTLSASGTYTALNILTRSTGTITPNGKTIGQLQISNVSGQTTTLAGALGCTTYVQGGGSGTFDLAFFNLTCSSEASFQANNTLINIGTITCTLFTIVNGTFTMTQGTITPSTAVQVQGTGVFNYNGGTLSPVPTFTHTAGTVTLGQSYALTATGTYTLTAGSLTLNGFDLTTGIFASSGSSVRSIAFGTNNIILSHTTAAQTVLSMANATNFTLSGTGRFTTEMSVARTFTFGTTGGTAANAPNLSITSGAAVPTFTDGSWFDVLNLTGSTCAPAMSASAIGINVDTLTLATGGTYTGFIPVFTRTQTWTAQFSKQLGGIGVNGSGVTLTLDNTQTYTATSVLIVTAGTLDLAGYDLTIGTVNSSNTNTRSIAFGTNNIILSTTTAAAVNLSMAIATGFTYTGTGGFTATADITRTYTFGTTGGSITNAPNLTLTGSGNAIQTMTTTSWFKNLNFGTTAYSVPTTEIQVDTLTLSSSGTYTELTPIFTRTQTWTPQFSKQLNGMGVNITSGTLTFGGSQSFTATSIFTLTAGTLDLNGFDQTFGIFTSNNANVRSIAFGSNNIILAHTTAATTVLSMANATNFTISGTGGFTAAANITRTFTFGTTGGSSTNSPNLTLTGSGTAIQTMSNTSWFNKLDFGTTAFDPGSSSLNFNSLTLSAGGTYGNISVTMRGNGTLNTNGKTIATLTINHTDPTGTTTLASAVTSQNNVTTTLTAGTLDLANFNLTTGTFSSTGTTTRSIAFGSGNIFLVHISGAQGVLAMATATGFTCTGTGGFASNMSVTRTFTFGTTGGSANNAPNLSLTSGASTFTIATGSWFKVLNFTGTTSTPAASTFYVDTLTLATGGTYTNIVPVFTRTQTWTAQFSKQLAGIGVNGSGVTLTLDNTQTYTATSQCSLVAGTIDLGGFNQTFGLFTSNNANVRSIAFGSNNIILAHTTAATTVLSMANATGFTYTGTGGFTAAADITRTFTFGTTGGATSNAPNLSLTGSGTAVQTFTTTSYFNTLNFGTTAFTIGSTVLNIVNLTLSSGGTFTSLNAQMSGDTFDIGTIISNGNTTLGTFTVTTSGTTRLGSSLTLSATGNTILFAGILDLNGYDLITGIFSSNYANTRSIAFGSNNIILAHTTAATTVLSMANATGFTYTGTGGFVTTAAVTRTFTFGTTGGSSTNSPNLTISGGSAVTLTNGSWFNHLLFTSGFSSSTIAGNTPNVNSLTLGVNASFTNTSFTMVGTGTITPNGKEILDLTINCTGGTTTLAEAFTVRTFTLTQGTFNVNNFIVTVGTNIGSGFISSNSNTRSIAFGTGNIIVRGSVGLQMANATNFTWTGTGGFTSDTTTSGREFTFGSTAGGSASNAPNLTIEGGTLSASFTAGSWFKTLNIINTSGTFTMSTTTSGIYVDTLSGLNSGDYTGLIPVFTRTQTWTMLNSKQLGGIGVNGSGVTLTLDGTQTFTSTALCYVYNGTLALTGASVTFSKFISNTSSTRSISFGIYSINLTSTSGFGSVYMLDIPDATNFTCTGTGGFISNVTSASFYYQFGSTAGGTAAGAPNLTINAGSNIIRIASGSWFKNLIFTGTTSTLPSINVYVDTLTLASGGTYSAMVPIFTRTQTWTPQFSKQLGGIGVKISSGTLTLEGTQTYATTSVCYVIEGTLDLGGANQTFGRLDSDTTLTRSIAFGSNNIILVQNTAGFVVLSVPDATNFTLTGTGGFTTAMSVTRTFTFGSTAGGSATNAPNLSLTSGASVPTITSGSWFKTLNFTGTTCTPATTTVNVDTLTLATGGTYSGLLPVFTRTQTWTAQFSKLLGGIGVNGSGVTLTLEATQTYSGVATLIVNAGTLAISTLDLSFYNFSSTGTGARSITGTGSINISNNWSVTSGSGFTGSGYSIKMSKSTSKTFAGGGGSYGTLVQQTASQLNITGSNTFVDIQVNNNMASPGQQEFTTAGTYSWTAPTGVTSVSVVAVGGGSGGSTADPGGGGGGGGLGWRNNIQVTPGQIYTVVVGNGSSAGTSTASGENSYFIDTSTVVGLGAGGASEDVGAIGGSYVGDGGGAGGNGGNPEGLNAFGGGGGGAGGYAGNGGNGSGRPTIAGDNGAGGGGGGGSGTATISNGSGGGVGIYGQGSSGAGGASTDSAGLGLPGQPGSGGSIGTLGNGGLYGGGGGGSDGEVTAGRGNGASGAVRIIWGADRAFPSTNTGNL